MFVFLFSNQLTSQADVRNNVANDLALLRVLVAQWIECLPGVWKVVGSIPLMDSDFFLSIAGSFQKVRICCL